MLIHKQTENGCPVFFWLVDDILYLRGLDSHCKLKLLSRTAMEQQEAMDEQRDILFSTLVSPDIVRPCTMDDGIIGIGEEEQSYFITTFRESTIPFSFFIPASGVGSRMFEFIYRFKQSANDAEREDYFQFISRLSSFAFYPLMAERWKSLTLNSEDELLAFCDYLLHPEGLNFRDIPKALFPFHLDGLTPRTPMESHILQAFKLSRKPSEIHFTIQQNHVKPIERQLEEWSERFPMALTSSVQPKHSDAFLFDEFKQPVLDGHGTPLRKPSGHGALIENLTPIETAVVFVKNIDNIQCNRMDDEVNRYWEMLGGLLLHLISTINEARETQDLNTILSLNQRFGFIPEIDGLADWETLSVVLNRPFRVCGMVRNEGMPGGGPFWVKHHDAVSKQIIEKAQISQGHLSSLSASTHFNPVMMALYKKDFDGQSFDLSSYVRKDLSMAVMKRNQGKLVYHIEKPGLWNGSMYDWNSVFVEVPSHIFSPVKSVLDLMDPIHQCYSTQTGGRMKEN